MKRYFRCEIKTASRCHQVTVNKWVNVIQPNHLNSWFIQEQNTIMRSEMQNCVKVAVFGIIFVVEINQKQAIWWLTQVS